MINCAWQKQVVFCCTGFSWATLRPFLHTGTQDWEHGLRLGFHNPGTWKWFPCYPGDRVPWTQPRVDLSVFSLCMQSEMLSPSVLLYRDLAGECWSTQWEVGGGVCVTETSKLSGGAVNRSLLEGMSGTCVLPREVILTTHCVISSTEATCESWVREDTV